jgi:hypothetical protein
MKLDYDINEYHIEDALLNIVAGANNLVVTTRCNIGCIFCSRKFNPFRSYSFDKNFEDIKNEINMFRPDRMIRVNTSISRMTDGEPFVHPKIWEIFSYIRNKFPYDPKTGFSRIQITTNGTLLTDECLRKMNELGGFVIIHSINSTNLNDWLKLHGSIREHAETSTTLPDRVRKFGSIEYYASMVAMPEVTGWNGIENTITDLDRFGCKYLRIFLPTYTKFASEEEQKMLHCDFPTLKKIVAELGKKTSILIQLYPFVHEDLTPKLKLFESIGLSSEDEILEINGIKPFSRSHAQSMLIGGKSLKIIQVLGNDGKKRQIITDPLKIKYTIGHEINQDFRAMPSEISDAAGEKKKILVLASTIAFELVKKAFSKAKEVEPRLRGKEFYFQKVENDFFGGSVQAGGLLVYDDYKKYAEKFIKENFSPELILVGDASFDIFGRDLLRNSIYELGRELGVPVEIVNSMLYKPGPAKT